MADTTTTTYGLVKPEVGASEDTWGTKSNTNLDTIDNLLDGTTAIAPNLSALKIGGTAVTASVAELNKMDGLTASTTELNTMDGLTASTAELNKMDGVTASTAEINYIDGVTSNIQTQLNSKTDTTYSAGAGLDLSGTTFSIETDLRGDAYIIGRDSNDYYNIETTRHRWYLDGSEDMRLENDGDLHVEGNVIAYSTTISDERLKTDIVKIDGALDKVAQLNGYTFTYTADGKQSAGVIAQEVQKVLPSAIVGSTLPLKMGDDDETEYMTVQYDQLIGLLVEAVKELKAEIAELKGK